MKKAYAIIFDENFDSDSLKNDLLEVVRSNFPSKKARQSVMIFSSEIKSSREVYELIESKTKPKISNFFVIELNNFYGVFNEDALNWLRDQFPNDKFVIADV